MPSSVPSPAGKPSGEAHSLEHELLHGLPPVIARHTRLVLLGSFPGAASLAAGQYYAHPRNQFWPLLAALLDEDLPALGYARRLQRLCARGLGLWDVIGRCRRRGSLDAAIVRGSEVANAVPAPGGGLEGLAVLLEGTIAGAGLTVALADGQRIALHNVTLVGE